MLALGCLLVSFVMLGAPVFYVVWSVVYLVWTSVSSAVLGLLGLTVQVLVVTTASWAKLQFVEPMVFLESMSGLHVPLCVTWCAGVPVLGPVLVRGVGPVLGLMVYGVLLLLAELSVVPVGNGAIYGLLVGLVLDFFPGPLFTF